MGTKPAPGVVNAQELYTLEEIQHRLKLGAWALRKARQAGLPVHRIGRRSYVKGADLLAFLDKQAKRSPRRSA